MSPAIAVVFYLLLIFCLASLFAGSFTNPGILPRGLQPIPELQPTVVAADGTVQVPQPGAAFEVVQIYTVRGVEVKNRYCYTCSLARPPRVSHCSRCDNCVERFDHRNKIFSFFSFFWPSFSTYPGRLSLPPASIDCPWVGNCIGKRNHKYFVLFTSSCTVLAFYVLAWSLAHFVVICLESQGEDGGDKFLDALTTTPLSYVITRSRVLSHTLKTSLQIYFGDLFCPLHAECGGPGWHASVLCVFEPDNE